MINSFNSFVKVSNSTKAYYSLLDEDFLGDFAGGHAAAVGEQGLNHDWLVDVGHVGHILRKPKTPQHKT